MPMPSKAPDAEEAKQSLFSYAKAWGENPLPPTLLATLITAQHFRPFQTLPMLFPPVLLFSSYLNVQGFKKDSAGMMSAWSLAYFVLARRRHQPLRQKFGVRGVVRGATVGLCAVNALAGGWTYWTAKKADVPEV
ncbi:hypothetical protein TI39_contig350g00034 [Zymoseptoria brevis]|uniref:Altered inheritance of mitochondria protein 19 n=3 Tax=Zymoseptoria TaxID=1047167 RepID=A0A0F4GRF9_9PEZI|nr:uncharacterized protein MYCGRDRAFT_77548 [Zymoseptoria tritici IPO323]EGP83070.1 hypothetical protein MYCGRDRAFT_77548 [Zymoseptoria tritici IPO323]KJX99828.1 hypothetical protein TI39_contig350g00034 [Zymoseptoria brevis]SMQ55864.1 unnamed protein product [Zymoseptoria tritici ST99CH_3D7]